MKNYKPGQFVSIGGRLARVCEKKADITHICTKCQKENNTRCNACSECIKKLGKMGPLYPKFVK